MALLSWVTLGLPAALILTFMYSTLAPKGKLVAYMAVALGVPLLALWLFVINAYRHSNWLPFGKGSMVPHFLTALISLALLIGSLVKVSGSLVAKVLVAVLASGLWVAVWFYGTLFVACAMGDCL